MGTGDRRGGADAGCGRQHRRHPRHLAAPQDGRGPGGSRTTSEQWAQLTDGMNELGRRILDEYGLAVQFHPHADSHVGYQPEIERFLDATDPQWVNLCFDTGHIAYYGGDCLELIKNYPIGSAICTSSR